MKKWGIFGGSFDPPHVAHLMAAVYAIETIPLEKILIIPCSSHPFNKNISDFKHRLEMCKIAFNILSDYIEISDIENKIGGISYTIDTILILKKRYADVEFSLIIGSDILPETNKWKDFDRIKKETSLFILPRPGNSNSSASFILPDISSTQIRKLRNKNEKITGLVPYLIEQYIINNNLYK